LNKTIVWLVFFIVASMAVGVGIMVQQFLVWGHVWDFNQTLHHEFFAGVFFAFSIGICVAIFMLKGGKRN
jgi:hypothetical protein